MEQNNNDQVSQLAAEIKAETTSGADATVKMNAADVQEAPPKNPLKEQLDALKQKRKSEGLTVSEELKLRRLTKQVSQKLNQGNMFQEYMAQYNRNQERYQKRLRTRIKIAFHHIGKKNMKMLKDLFTVNVPEQKDNEGNVTQAAYTYINYEGLLLEAQNVVVMERQARIDAGQRKKTTGSGSQRRMQSASYKFLMQRNETEAAKQVENK